MTASNLLLSAPQLYLGFDKDISNKIKEIEKNNKSNQNR